MVPDSRDAETERLRQLLTELMELERPRNRGRLELGEIDIDLFAEDSYLAGMVSSFLAGDPVREGFIPLNASIDEELEKIEAPPGAETVLERLKEYRNKLKDLASALSHAADVPIVYVRKTP